MRFFRFIAFLAIQRAFGFAPTAKKIWKSSASRFVPLANQSSRKKESYVIFAKIQENQALVDSSRQFPLKIQ